MQLHRTSLAVAICLVYMLGASALEADKDQDIVYSSLGRSTSRMEGDVRIVTLEDDVKVTQGTLEITGDNAVFESEPGSSAIRQVTVSGAPAKYRQQLDNDGEYVEGESASIYYYVEGEPIVEFVGEATLRSNNNILSGASIKYFTDSRFTETTGPCEGVSSRTTLAAPAADSPPAN